MNVVFLFTGFLFVAGLGYAFSHNRKAIRLRPIIAMMIAQLVLAFLLLNTGCRD